MENLLTWNMAIFEWMNDFGSQKINVICPPLPRALSHKKWYFNIDKHLCIIFHEQIMLDWLLLLWTKEVFGNNKNYNLMNNFFCFHFHYFYTICINVTIWVLFIVYELFNNLFNCCCRCRLADEKWINFTWMGSECVLQNYTVIMDRNLLEFQQISLWILCGNEVVWCFNYEAIYWEHGWVIKENWIQ